MTFVAIEGPEPWTIPGCIVMGKVGLSAFVNTPAGGAVSLFSIGMALAAADFSWPRLAVAAGGARTLPVGTPAPCAFDETASNAVPIHNARFLMLMLPQ